MNRDQRRMTAYNAKKSNQEVQKLSKRKATTRCDKAVNFTLNLRDRK